MGTALANDELVSRLTSEDETVWPVSVAQVKANAQVPHDDDDQLLNDQIIPSAVAFIENLGRVSLITQTRKVTHDFSFPEIIETRWPLQSVVSVTYLDADYATQTIASTDYRALTAGKPGRVAAKSATPWPTPVAEKEVAIATYKSGFGDTPASVPPEWKHPVIFLAGYWWEHRESYEAQFVNQAFFDVLTKLVEVAGGLKRYV
jgi:uncharacterized phiE125 gp8 family phage protein